MTPPQLYVAVITPFYQEKPGLLARALRTAFAQDLPAHVSLEVFVVDDASPVSAEADLATLPPMDRARIHLIHQDNAGPGAARNTALDHIDPKRFAYIAFLDSDDEWRPTHLAEAIAALEQGYDFYFCNHTRFNTGDTYFDEGRQTADWQANPTPPVHPLNAEGSLLHIAAPTIFEAFLTEYLSQTSTVVYRYAKAPKHRFIPEQRKAGEDFLFWLGLLRADLRCVVNYRANVHCGEGINVYASAYDFASPKVVERVGYILLCQFRIREDFGDYARNQAFIRTQITRYTRAYGYLLMRSLLKGQKPDFGLFWRILRKAPLRTIAAPFTFLSVLPTRAEEAQLW